MYRAVIVVVDKGREKRSWMWPRGWSPQGYHNQRSRFGDPRDFAFLEHGS